MNKVILIGNVGSQPESKVIGDTDMVKFSVATNEYFKDKLGERQERTEWHNCVAWRATAGFIGTYINKGDKVSIEGKIQTKSYEKEGRTVYFTEILVDKIERVCKREGI